VVEGVNVLEAALDGDADIEALFAAPEAESECPALLDRAARRGILVHRLGPGVLERVAGTVTPQPVLAVARRRPPALADVAAGQGAEPRLLVVGVDVRDPGNGGTLIRSAEAAGAHGVEVGGKPGGLEGGALAREWDAWARRWEDDLDSVSQRCRLDSSGDAAARALSDALDGIEELRRLLSRSGADAAEEARKVKEALAQARRELKGR